MKKTYDITIIGAGIVGRALAYGLSREGFRVALVDQHPIKTEPSNDIGLRVSAINHASRAFFEVLGVWDEILAFRHMPYEKMTVWNHDGDIHFDSHAINEDNLGYIIENQHTLAALGKALANSNVDCYTEVRPRQLTPFFDDAQILLSNGERLQSSLIIGADGASSWVRQRVGIDINKRDYGHTAIVSVVKTEKPHEHTAWQRFTNTGPLAFLPLHDENLCSSVWSQNTEAAEKLLALDETAFCDELAKAFENRLGSLSLSS